MQWLRSNSELNIELNINYVLFGVVDPIPSKDLINFIILCTKYFIHKCRLNKIIPTFGNLLIYISWKKKVEKYAFSLTDSPEKFVRKWRPLISI